MLICAVSCLYCTILQLVFAVFYLRIASQPPTLALHLLQLIVALTTVLHLLLFYIVTVLYTVLLCVLQLSLLYHPLIKYKRSIRKSHIRKKIFLMIITLQSAVFIVKSSSWSLWKSHFSINKRSQTLIILSRLKSRQSSSNGVLFVTKNSNTLLYTSALTTPSTL